MSSTTTLQYNNTTLFGECLKLPYYFGAVEDWMIVVNGVYIAINILSVFVTLAANTAFLLVYFRTRLLRMPHYFFLMVLAITDVSVGLISQPLFISRMIMELYSKHDCGLWTTMRATIYYFSGISFLTLTLVSFERFYAVCRPLKHRQKVTESRMASLAIIVWLLWLVFPTLRFLLPEYYKVFGMLIGGIILALFVTNVYVYIKIQRCVSGKHLTKMNIQIRKTTQMKDMAREARLARTSACLLLVMVLAYLPTALGLAYKAIVGVNTTYMFIFLPIADTLVLANSSFNPLFYCYKNKNIRNAIFKYFKIVIAKKGRTSSMDCS